MDPWDIRERLKRIEADLLALVNLPKTLERLETDIVRIELKLDAQSKLLARLWTLLTGSGVPDDLQLQVGKDDKMANVTCKLFPKSHKLGAMMQPVTLKPTDTTISLVTVDANGNPVPVDMTKVTTTCDDASNPALVITKVDETHYTFTIPANTPPTTVPVTSTETYTDGSAGPFNASIAVTTPTPPPPVPMDLTLVIS